MWVCKKCKTENWNNDLNCKKCGTHKNTEVQEEEVQNAEVQNAEVQNVEVRGNTNKILYGIIAVMAVVIVILLLPRGNKVPVVDSSVTTPAETNTPAASQVEFSTTGPTLLARNTVAATDHGVVGVKPDGTCIATGDISTSSLSHWKDIIAVTASDNHVAALKSDGTVVCTDGFLGVDDFQDIVQIDYCSQDPFSEHAHLVGLDAYGHVVASGDNTFGQCDVQLWNDIVDISAGAHHTVGLKADGTVIAVGSNESGQCDVSSWRNIIDICAARYATYGLTADGKILVAGSHKNKKGNEYVTEVPQWDDVIAIMSGDEAGNACDFVVGLRSDGTIVTNHLGYVGEEEIASFSDVKSIAVASWGYMICVDSQGQVKSIGWDVDGTRVVDSWPNLMTN